MQNTLPQSISRPRALFFGLIFFTGLAFSFYMFFLGRTIFDLVDRKNAEYEIRLATSRISDLELQVLDYNNKVTLQQAYDLGFMSNSNPEFVSREQAAMLR